MQWWTVEDAAELTVVAVCLTAQLIANKIKFMEKTARESSSSGLSLCIINELYTSAYIHIFIYPPSRMYEDDLFMLFLIVCTQTKLRASYVTRRSFFSRCGAVIGAIDCTLRWLKARLLGESLDWQQDLTLRLITIYCPEDPHTHTHRVMFILSHCHVPLLEDLQRQLYETSQEIVV